MYVVYRMSYIVCVYTVDKTPYVVNSNYCHHHYIKIVSTIAIMAVKAVVQSLLLESIMMPTQSTVRGCKPSWH